MVFRSIFSIEETVWRAVPRRVGSNVTCPAVHVLRSSTDLFRDFCSLGLGISGNAAESFLYLPADIFGGSADTILVHDSSFAREGRRQWYRGFRRQLGCVDFTGRAS
jgi:hypothetical protein